MLKLTITDVFLRTIPESLIIVLALYLFSFKPIVKKNYFISSAALAIITYVVRMLPIQFGIHTILNIIGYIVVSIYIIRLPITKAISSVLLIIVSLSICEWLNITILSSLLNMDVPTLFKDSVIKDIAMFPSLVFFGIILIIIYFTLYRAKKERN